MPLPVRALAPFTPRPEVLPRPEDEPRPTLSLCLCAPGLLLIWLSFILFAFFDDLDEVLDRVDHAAHRRRIFQGAGAADLAEAQPAQSLRLNVGLAVGGTYLANGDGLATGLLGGRRRLGFLLGHDASLYLSGRGFGGGAFALGQNFGNAAATAIGDHARRLLILQRVKGGAHHIVGIGGAQRL